MEFLTYIYPCQNHSWVGVSFWSNDTIKNSHVKFNSTKKTKLFQDQGNFFWVLWHEFLFSKNSFKMFIAVTQILLLTILWTDQNTNTFKINHQNKKSYNLDFIYFACCDILGIFRYLKSFKFMIAYLSHFYPMVMNILVYEQPYGHNMHKTTPCCQAVANLLTRIDTLKFCYIDKLLIFSCTGSTQKPT